MLPNSATISSWGEFSKNFYSLNRTQNVLLCQICLKHYAVMVQNDDAERIFKKLQRRVAQIRVEKSITQEQLAEILNVDSRTIRRWEDPNRMQLTLWALCRLSLAFKCPFETFSINSMNENTISKKSKKNK
jgi:DNA-binding XRE family transcriptional regulator